MEASDMSLTILNSKINIAERKTRYVKDSDVRLYVLKKKKNVVVLYHINE